MTGSAARQLALSFATGRRRLEFVYRPGGTLSEFPFLSQVERVARWV
jgi:hypothetical protein